MDLIWTIILAVSGILLGLAISAVLIIFDGRSRRRPARTATPRAITASTPSQPQAATIPQQPLSAAPKALVTRETVTARDHLPYALTPQLLSAAEQDFFQALRAAAPGDLLVFPQVRLAGLVHTTERHQRRRQYDFYRIQAKTVDFVLCDARTTAPRLVVELDDSSHDQAHRRERDAFVDEVLASVGLPILHLRWQRAYDRAELARLIRERLGLPTPVTTPAAAVPPREPAPPPPTHQPVQPPIPAAPRQQLPVPAEPISGSGQHIVDAAPSAAAVVCGRCRAAVRMSAAFCPACGASLA